MKALLLLPLLLLLDPGPAAADSGVCSAMCNPWSANYWGDALITSQAAADEYACFRRIVGSLTVVQSGPKLIVLPKLRGILGDLRVVFPRLEGRLELQQALAAMLPELEEIRGDVELQYTRGELPGSVAAISSKR